MAPDLNIYGGGGGGGGGGNRLGIMRSSRARLNYLFRFDTLSLCKCVVRCVISTCLRGVYGAQLSPY